MTTKLTFICSYQGDQDFRFDGRRYSIHLAVDRSPYWNPGVVDEKRALLGTVTGRLDEFPPPEVCALFPGYVPARWVNGAAEYQGEPPVVLETSTGWEAAVHREEQRRADAAGEKWTRLRDLAGARYGWGSYEFRRIDAWLRSRLFEKRC